MNYERSQMEEIRRQAKLETCRQSFQDYCEYVHRHLAGNKCWKPYSVHKLICGKLQEIIDKGGKRLIITMPPRHGKSMTITETFPSYYLGRFPDNRVIEVSYGDSLAQRFGQKNREKIVEFGKEIFGIEISRSNSSKTDWGVQGHIGGMLSLGIGGGATGHGADLLIIDDPIKNREQANSQVYRDKIWDEWADTFYSRLHSGASVIVILTRWHEDDLVGRLLSHEYDGDPGEWEVISLPAIAEDESDLLKRKIGEALCPKIKTIEELIDIKTTVGSMSFASLYQQRPSPAEGNIFNRSWWRFYNHNDLPQKFDEIIQSWDCTFKKLDDNDYVCGQVWGRAGANKYLLDQIRERMGIIGTMNAIRNMSKKWWTCNSILIEDKANGPAVIELLKNEIPGIIPVEPAGGKIVRAQAASPEVEAGNIYLPNMAQALWIDDFIEECTAFPNGANDDQVDAMTQAINRFRSAKTGSWEDANKFNKSSGFDIGFGSQRF